MSACPDCEETTRRYGAPDRSCDKHWQEDHPNGFSMKFESTDVNPRALELFFGLSSNRGTTP
jgi:hypothetical protein